MTIQDAAGQSRLDAVKQFLDPKRSNFLAEVEKKFRTRTFRFSRNAQKLESPQTLQADGSGTSLESAIDDVMKELDAAPLASIVLFTDGADNRSKNLATVLGKLQSRKIAVNVCAVGSPEIENDIELIQASAPQTVSAGIDHDRACLFAKQRLRGQERGSGGARGRQAGAIQASRADPE